MSETERADLLESLRFQRDLLIGTVDGLADDQARARPTASSLCLGGVLRHVAFTEQKWCDFVEQGPGPDDDVDWETVDWSDPPPGVRAQADSFTMGEDLTLDEVVAAAREAGARTDALVGSVDLDRAWPLPTAPWFEPGATRSARRVFLGLVGEIAQHAGHADIIRETIDGRRSMG
ncbi:DinB family protein [Nocardioides marmoraquaticus]